MGETHISRRGKGRAEVPLELHGMTQGQDRKDQDDG